MSLVERARGPKLPIKLQALAKSGKRFSDIAKRNNLDRTHILKVVSGNYNSSRVDKILQTEWGITVEEARSIYKEHKERMESGNPVTTREAFEFKQSINYRLAVSCGKTTKTWKEYLSVMDQISWPTFQYAFMQRGVAT
ncbi:hypothetical protein [Leptospira brenneri]|uniref:hypothetical protein n=1 Tax=Leptospira brenneri TaxID=2023182 RepID=UPI000C2A007D|nr:hypothetical protein [Leptospira brenneri]PJZ43705.1 hypothetical protein CH361_19195 [Leptospira brenneri]